MVLHAAIHPYSTCMGVMLVHPAVSHATVTISNSNVEMKCIIIKPRWLINKNIEMRHSALRYAMWSKGCAIGRQGCLVQQINTSREIAAGDVQDIGSSGSNRGRRRRLKLESCCLCRDSCKCVEK